MSWGVVTVVYAEQLTQSRLLIRQIICIIIIIDINSVYVTQWNPPSNTTSSYLWE